jgi:hypothetical protein
LRAATRSGDCYRRVSLHLPFAAFAPELHACFVKATVPVESAGGQLTALRIEGEFAVARDALALAAKAECLEPGQK